MGIIKDCVADARQPQLPQLNELLTHCVCQLCERNKLETLSCVKVARNERWISGVLSNNNSRPTGSRLPCLLGHEWTGKRSLVSTVNTNLLPIVSYSMYSSIRCTHKDLLTRPYKLCRCQCVSRLKIHKCYNFHSRGSVRLIDICIYKFGPHREQTHGVM